MSDDETNVLRPVFGSQTTVRRDGYCRHAQMEIDEEKRTLSCKACGALLDPFQVHLEYARRERRWHHWDGEAREAEKRLDELKEEERKVKARTKAASRKDASEAVAAERSQNAKRLEMVIRKVRELDGVVRQLRALLRDEVAEERVRRLQRRIRARPTTIVKP